MAEIAAILTVTAAIVSCDGGNYALLARDLHCDSGNCALGRRQLRLVMAAISVVMASQAL